MNIWRKNAHLKSVVLIGQNVLQLFVAVTLWQTRRGRYMVQRKGRAWGVVQGQAGFQETPNLFTLIITGPFLKCIKSNCVNTISVVYFLCVAPFVQYVTYNHICANVYLRHSSLWLQLEAELAVVVFLCGCICFTWDECLITTADKLMKMLSHPDHGKLKIKGNKTKLGLLQNLLLFF